MPTLQFKFLVFSLLLLTVATTLASSQYEGFNLRLNTSIIKSKDDNLLSLICHYHAIQDNEKTTDEVRIHRAANVLSFWLNDTQITSGTNGGLPGYREWDFESGAMAQFILPKKDIFIGLFCCKSMTETSSMVQLISMPEKDLSVALYMAVAVCSLFLALLILLSIFTFVLCYKQFQKRRFDSLKDARFSSSRSKKRTISEYPQRPTAMNTSCTNLFTINLETGQQEDRSSKPTNTSCTKFEKNQEDHSLCSSTLSKADVKQFCYIDSPEEVMFDCKGGRYRNEDHDIELSVPEFAIPTGKRITVKIAVSLFSPLQLQQGLRPVSPIVEFCVVDDPHFKFAKPIKILLPHFMSTTSSSLNDLQFVKAAYGGGVFEECDGEATFKAGSMYGTLLTHHFCHFCIASSVSSLSKVNYRLVRVTPKNPSGTWKAQYCVTYFLQTCLKFLKNFYDVEQYEVTSLKKFVFSNAQATLQIHFERRLAGGWLLTQDGGSSKLTENEVDCWRLDQDELKQMEEEELYPPRFVVKVNGHQATDQATALVRFTGAQGDLETELSLEPPSYHQITHLPTSVSLPNIRRPYDVSKQSQQYNLVNPNTPSLSFLMNYIAAEIPAKWRAVGTQLNLSNGKLDQIEYEHRGSCDCCFSAVFSLWESQPNSAALPYEWFSLYEALRSPQVSENQLANKLEMIVSTTTSNASLSGNGSSTDKDDKNYDGDEMDG